MVVKQLGGSSLGCDISSSRLHSLGSLPKLGRCNGPKVDGLVPVSILCITARARGKGRDQRARLPQAGMPTAGCHRQASQSVAETKAESDRWQQGGTRMETEIVTYVKDLTYSRQLQQTPCAMPPRSTPKPMADISDWSHGFLPLSLGGASRLSTPYSWTLQIGFDIHHDIFPSRF